jgi:TPR repeat protein
LFESEDPDLSLQWYYRNSSASFLRIAQLLKKGQQINAAKNFVRRPYDSTSLNYFGLIVTGRYKKLLLYRKAFHLGSVSALWNMAIELDTNTATQSEQKQALKYYLKGAELGDCDCQWKLGMCYETGRLGLEKNVTNELNWKARAVANGYQPDG